MFRSYLSRENLVLIKMVEGWQYVQHFQLKDYWRARSHKQPYVDS